MPKDESDPDDPLELNGIAVPATEADLKEAARCFVEEFAWIGYDRVRLLKMFRDPFYRGVHDIWLQMGDAWVEAVIEEVANEWGAGRARIRGL